MISGRSGNGKLTEAINGDSSLSVVLDNLVGG